MSRRRFPSKKGGHRDQCCTKTICCPKPRCEEPQIIAPEIIMPIMPVPPEDFPLSKCDDVFDWKEIDTRCNMRPQRSDGVRDRCSGRCVNKYQQFPIKYYMD